VPAPTAPTAKERILATANALFYEEGIRAVGIDKIIEQSGIAKMTLYRHFASKDDLVVAYLSALIHAYWVWFDQVIAANVGKPRLQMLDLFDALAAKLRANDCRGCAFSNVVTEFPNPQHPGRQVALAHSLEVRKRLTALAEQAGASDPARLGDQLALLLDGAYAQGQKSAGGQAALHARDMADILMAAQLPQAHD
jgi:AcrR family transcriptional regulator